MRGVWERRGRNEDRGEGNKGPIPILPFDFILYPKSGGHSLKELFSKETFGTVYPSCDVLGPK